MRTVPFVTPVPAPAANTVAPPAQDEVIDLSEILSQKAAPAAFQPAITEAEVESETQTQAGPGETKPEEAAPAADAPKFDDAKFESFKNMAEKTVSNFIKEPKKFAGLIVKFGNMLRVFLYPFLFRGMVFEADEYKDAQATMKKVVANKKENKPPTEGLNNYELELLQKWNDFVSLKKKIPLTKEEEEWIVEIAHEKIAQMPWAQWLEEHSWVLVLIYIESQRVIPAVGVKMQNDMLKDFNVNEAA